jgi:hypothetical protein
VPSEPRQPGTPAPERAQARSRPGATHAAGDSKTAAAPPRSPRQPKPLDAGPFAADVDSFRLHLAAENKAAKTLAAYTGAARGLLTGDRLGTYRASWVCQAEKIWSRGGRPACLRARSSQDSSSLYSSRQVLACSRPRGVSGTIMVSRTRAAGRTLRSP